MTTAADYHGRVAGYGWGELWELWQGVLDRSTIGWEPGKALEYLVLRAFELSGAEVRWPYSVRIDGEEIEQIDGVVYADGLAFLVECKDVLRPIGAEPIAKVRHQLARRPAGVIGMLFSRSGFSSPAVVLARYAGPQTIILWSGLDIEFMLRIRDARDALRMKYQRCVEHGDPSFDLA